MQNIQLYDNTKAVDKIHDDRKQKVMKFILAFHLLLVALFSKLCKITLFEELPASRIFCNSGKQITLSTFIS